MTRVGPQGHGGRWRGGGRLYSYFPFLLRAQPSIAGRYWHCHM